MLILIWVDALDVRGYCTPWRASYQTLVSDTDYDCPLIGRGGTWRHLPRASIALGLQSLASDLGIKLRVEILTDATAAIGICRRRGLGEIRH